MSGLSPAALQTLGDALASQQQTVSREFHAFCHLCPADSESRLLALDKSTLANYNNLCKTAITQWLCRDHAYDVNLDIPSLTTRNSTLPAAIQKRDSYCVVTGQSPDSSQVAHILPYSVGKSQARSAIDLWAVLAMFWGEQRTRGLKSLIFGEPSLIQPDTKTLVNRIDNMLLLSADAHKHPCNIPEQSPKPSENLLYDFRANCRVTTGHIIHFSTGDPEERPLPHPDLLRLQGFLIRVLRMAGRAGEEELAIGRSDGNPLPDYDEEGNQIKHRDSNLTSSCADGNRNGTEVTQGDTMDVKPSTLSNIRNVTPPTSLWESTIGWLRKRAGRISHSTGREMSRDHPTRKSM
ncbi:MAG: hypothetical protein M1813_007925 [Trichoglossum hirsutum]|nr:MAG: hypothetical protein M1813_007925 [Trichoglossum hirsutum]